MDPDNFGRKVGKNVSMLATNVTLRKGGSGRKHKNKSKIAWFGVWQNRFVEAENWQICLLKLLRLTLRHVTEMLKC